MQFRQGEESEEESESVDEKGVRHEPGSTRAFRHHRHAAIRRKKRPSSMVMRPSTSRRLNSGKSGSGGSTISGSVKREDPQGKIIRMKKTGGGGLGPGGVGAPKPPLTKQMSRQSLHSRKRLANMLVAMVVVFVTCWFPYVIVRISIEFNTRLDEFLRSVLPFCLLLGHTHSTINPLVYWSLNRQSLQLNSSCYDWLKIRTNRDSSTQESKFYFANHLRFLSNHNHARGHKHHQPPSSTNEAALGVFHPRYTVPKPQNRLNQKRESSVYLA